MTEYLFMRENDLTAAVAAAVAALGLGTAAYEDIGFFATAAQGAKADTALQPAAIGVSIQAYSAALAAYPDPTANDADSLGTAAAGWSDLFLAAGGLISWNNGGVVIYENSDALVFGNAAAGYFFDNPIGIVSSDPFITLTDSDTGATAQIGGTSTAGSLTLAADIANAVAGSVIRFEIDGTGRVQVGTDNMRPVTGVVQSLGNGTQAWSALFLSASGAISVGGAAVLDGVGGLSTQTATAAAIAAIGNAINTADKRAGKMVFDTTNNRLMIAVGSTAGSNWAVADGSATVTPA